MRPWPVRVQVQELVWRGHRGTNPRKHERERHKRSRRRCRVHVELRSRHEPVGAGGVVTEHI